MNELLVDGLLVLSLLIAATAAMIYGQRYQEHVRGPNSNDDASMMPPF